MMPAAEHPPDPLAGTLGENVWSLCSHLVSVGIAGTSGDPPAALLEEISAGGMRLALDERVPEGTTVLVRAGGFEAQVTVVECRVRSDDFCVEARFQEGVRWNPDLWTPDHLYLPPARRVKAAGTS